MRNLRNFLITYGICLLCFGAMGALVMKSALGFAEKPEETHEDPPIIKEDPEVKPTGADAEDEESGSSFTILLGAKDAVTGEYDAFVLLSVNKENHEYLVSTIPANMVLNVGPVEYSLGELEEEKGRKYLLDKIYALTGLRVDSHAFMRLSDFVKVIDTIGGVTFTVPENMYYQDVNGNVLVNLKKGTRTLSGAESLMLLRYRGYEEGDAKRCEVQRDFMFTALDQLLDKKNIENAKEIVPKIIGMVDTDYTAADFLGNIDVIFSYRDFAKNEISYPGVFKTSDDGTERFIPRIDEAIALYREHR